MTSELTMPLSLDDIVKEVETAVAHGRLEPNRAADLLVFLAVKYSRAVDNYMVKKAEYAKAFTEERENHKSDTACERFLDHTETGLEVSHWKYQTRKCEMLTNVLKTFIYQKGNEARNVQ